MSAITDFTNKRFSTSNRVHKMFHETTISLHSLQLHWITILLLAEIIAFVFNMATKFVFVSAALQFPGRGGKWRAPITHTVNGMALVHTWHLQRDGDALRERKKNHQDGWLPPHFAAKPFCLAESPPTAHWARKTFGREVTRTRKGTYPVWVSDFA